MDEKVNKRNRLKDSDLNKNKQKILLFKNS